jgi:hypothetical protein
MTSRVQRHHLPRATMSALLVAGAVFGLVSSTSLRRPALLVGYGNSAWHATAAPGSGWTDPGVTAGAPETVSFSISGTVTGLYPGKTRQLVLTVANPQKVSITVTSITTKVSNASTKCVAANLVVTAFSGHLVVPAGKTAKATVNATMPHSAPNGCQGAHFPLAYTGVATEA